MTLENILLIANENKNMYVWDNGEIVASYDGKDSIPEELNNRIVDMLDCENNEFHVYLAGE